MSGKTFTAIGITLLALISLGASIVSAAFGNAWMAAGWWLGASILFILAAIVLTHD